ncbi:RNA-directed DNA polymerase (Reverse transcriptase), Ribonuclease H [Gossypium australe]|uniref:RNA-directed DNA polymerase (Reverse transcriptase), Ribonuclease H n=1 Tax=Gossypium australe TaxID=47621 RepID=A0A5B6VWH9_9ROSI|nr:RNA-directed DNA polymerase (Reverse transcriptase), Ribonuclease H [Gossypium australe]
MPKWEGPYVVKKVFFGGALILTEMDGKNLPNLIRSRNTSPKRKGGEAKAKTLNGRLETKGI